MDESKPDQSLDKGVGASNVLEGGKEGTNALARIRMHRKHNKETHGLREDIDVNTPISDVKGPNVFERVKEEFEAMVESIHPSKEERNQDSPSSVQRDDVTFTGSKHENQSSPADKGVKAPKVLEGGKEETDALAHMEIYPKHNKETHGLREDIDVNTPIGDVKGPNVFERVKEEFEAIVETIHSNKEERNQDSPSSVQRDVVTFTGSKPENQSSPADKGVKAPNMLGNDKEEIETLLHVEKHPPHNKETHGLRDDIDVNTPISDIKGPNVFDRVMEEFEAIVETIRPSKEDKNQDSPSSVERDDAKFTGSKNEKQNLLPEDHTGTPTKIKQENSEVKDNTNKEKSPVAHHKETHGKGEIDADIPISEFKGPSILHRAKEEVEAIVDTIQSKKESDNDAPTPKKEGGFRATISKKLHRIYSKGKNRD